MRLSSILKKEEVKRLNFGEASNVSLAEFKQPPDAPCLEGLAFSSLKERPRSADELYRQLTDLMVLVLGNIDRNEPVDISLIKEKIDLLIERVESGDPDLLVLMNNRAQDKDYLITHSVNVCVLSLTVGRGLKYKRQQLEDLGIGAFLHDVGMARVKKEIIKKSRKLDTAEYEQVKKHADYGIEILGNLKGINQDILAIVGEHQERADGSGYPGGLTLEKINKYARIVTLADVYDALTHSRPYREKLEPFEDIVVHQIISSRRLFDPYVLEVFLGSLTRYPAYMLWLAADGIYRALNEYKGEKKQSRPKRNLLLAAVFLALVSAVFIPHILRPKAAKVLYPMGESLYLVKNKLPLKIAYDFTNDVSEVKSISLELKETDLSGYYFLGLLSRIEPLSPGLIKDAALKIEIENSRKEKSEYYLKGVSGSWQEFRVPLAYFDKLSDWSGITRIHFSLEPWNTRVEKGTLYVDGISFYRKE